LLKVAFRHARLTIFLLSCDALDFAESTMETAGFFRSLFNRAKVRSLGLPKGIENQLSRLEGRLKNSEKTTRRSHR
jgi:hypothetical protein